MGHYESASPFAVEGEAAGYASRTPTVSFSFPDPAASGLGSPGAEDTIALLEDIEIDMTIPSKLTALDFPKAEDGRDEDIAKVIRKSFSKLGLPHSPQDALSSLAKSGLSRHLSWQAQVEAAVEHQGEDFWERVSGQLLIVIGWCRVKRLLIGYI